MADEVKIIRLVIDSSRAVDGSAAATRALANIDKATGDAAGALARMERSLASMGSAIKAHLAIAIADMVARLVDITKRAIEAVGGLDELAEQIGTTARALQGFQFAAVQNGASLEQLEQGLNKFSVKMGEAANGSKEVIDALTRLNVKNLDIQGNLRPTEELLADVATALLAIEDPAKRSAAAVELFGKAGNKLLPTLKDFELGADALVVLAKAQNAYVSPETIKRLDEYSDRLERQKLQIRALAADGIVWLVEKLDALDAWLSKNANAFGDWARSLDLTPFLDGIRNSMDEAVIAGGRFVVTLIEYFKQLPSEIPKLFVDAMNGAIAAMERGLGSITSGLADSWIGRQLGITGGGVSLGRIEGGGAGTASDRFANARFAGSEWAATQRQRNQDVYAQQQVERDRARQAAAEQKAIEFADWFARMEASATGYTPPRPGASTTTPAGGGGTGKAQVDEVAKLIERIAKDAERAKESFLEGTDALVAQNDVLATEIKLLGETPEIRARELAVLKATNDAKKAGWDLDSQAYKDRLAAVETGEKLKIQQQELQRAQELWTAPLKSALESIQRIGADAWDKFLENGKFSFDELSKVFTTTLRRMAAEFLALATIRPVMSVLVNAVSPSMAQSMGLGSSGGGGLFGSGGSGLSIPSGGSGSGFLGNIGGWLNSPIMPQSIDAQIANWSTYGTAAQNSLSGGFLANTTWMQGIGALAGAGMGAYQLLSGGGSTSSMIGGISSIVGAGVSLIPGIGQIAGPAIALLGNLLPGLLGLDKPPTITNQEYGDLTYGSNGFFTSGGAWGPNANASNAQGALGGMGTTMQGIFNALGGVKDPSKVWGVALQNFSQQYGDKSSFSNQTSFLAGPNGERIQWGQGSTTADVGLEAAGLAAALKSIMGGAVGEISANLEKGLGTLNLDGKGTLAQLAAVVAEIKTFDDAIAGLGKTVTSAEQAILQIDQSFAAMYATAEKYGLPVGDVDAAKAKARLGVATDFGKSISRGILELTDPKAAALADLDDWRATMVDNNKWLLENVTGALDQINEIEKLYGLKRAQIVEASAQQSLAGLVDVIKRLTYGDLSGATPENMISGTRGTYNALLAKARAGDQSAIAGLGSAAADYAGAAKDYYAISPQYNAITAGLVSDLASVTANNGGSELLAALPNSLGILGQVLADLALQIKSANEDNAELKAKMDEVAALFQRAVNS